MFFLSISAYQCGTNVFGDSGTVTSPNYPNNYPDAATCYYFIRVPNAQRIIFNITDFQTEAGKDIFDYGQGSIANIANAIFSLSGTSNPLPYEYVIQSDQSWIVFQSDRNTGMKGWSLVYRAGK